MIVNGTNIRSLGVGFKATFQGAFDGVKPSYTNYATVVTSTTAAEDYGWLGDMPAIREWLGERVIHEMSASGYSLRNRSFELTVGVKKTAVEDDNIGIYGAQFAAMGKSGAIFPDKLLFALMSAGWSEKCFDGKPFFSKQHPIEIAGRKTVYANTDSDPGDTGAPWFLLDDGQFLKPFIYQERKKFQFVAKTDVSDDRVFFHDQYVYGMDGRCNVGFGLPQLCWASKKPLNAENYEVARAALGQMRGATGETLGVSGKVLLVGSTLEGAARRLLVNDYVAGGAANEWKGTARLDVCPLLPGPSA